MAIREILTYPNPILRRPAKELSMEEIHSPHIQQLIADMIETLYAFEGTVGLAAPQVGESVQIFVMDATAKSTRDRFMVFINPETPEMSKWKYSREGCLSFPDYLVTVKRARKITATRYTENGQWLEELFQDFEAIIIQHELDHLKGILFIDRIKNIQTDLVHRSQLPALKD